MPITNRTRVSVRTRWQGTNPFLTIATVSRFLPPFRRRIEETEVTCKVDFNLDDRPGSVCALVARIGPILTNTVCPWHLDLSACSYLGPHAGAIIVASLLDSRRRGQPARVTLPQGSKQLQAFCEFSGLLHYVTGSPFPNSGHPENVTIPMRQVTKSRFEDSDPIVGLIRQHAHLSDATEEYLRICVNEIIQNVEDHAQSSVGAMAAARFMQKSKEVRVAIVDRGLGIWTTLRRRHPDLRDAMDALDRVIQGGFSAKSRINNMGVGISNLCAIIANVLGGELFILSENGFADGKQGRHAISRSLDTVFPGTGVFSRCLFASDDIIRQSNG